MDQTVNKRLRSDLRRPAPKPVPPDIVVDNPAIQKVQRRIAAATLIVPAVFTVIALASLFWRPITALDLTLLLVLYVGTILGVTVGFHRLFSHRSYKAKTWLKVVLGGLGSMAAQGNLIYWVATHRRHHQFSEGEGDPHSPFVMDGKPLSWLRGLWHSHMGWMLDSEMTNTVKFAKDLMRDKAISRVNAAYFQWVALGLLLPAAIGGLLTLSWSGAIGGFLWGGMVRMFLVHHAMWTSGSIAHLIGARPFATRDMSTNNAFLAVPNLGEGWHNNHHAFPSSAHFGLFWWQIDIGGWFISAFQALGWVWDVRRPTREMIDAKLRDPLSAGPLEAENW